MPKKSDSSRGSRVRGRKNEKRRHAEDDERRELEKEKRYARCAQKERRTSPRRNLTARREREGGGEREVYIRYLIRDLRLP